MRSSRPLLITIHNLFAHLSNALAIIKDEWKIILIASGGVSLLSLTVPLYMLHLIDHVFMTGQIRNLIGITAVAVLAIILQWVLQAGRDKMLSAMIQQNMLNSHMAARKTSQTTSQQKSLLILVMDYIWLPLFLATLTLLHPVFGLYALVVAICLMTYEVMSLASHPHVASKHQGRYLGLQALQHKLGSYLSLKTSFQNIYDVSYQDHADHEDKVGRKQAHHQSSRMGIRVLATIGMYTVGAILVTRQELSPGSVIIAPILLNFILLPICKMDIFANLNDQQHDQGQNSGPVPSIDLSDDIYPEKIRLVNVTHVHKGAVNPVFHDLKMSLELSGISSFSGPAGSGKSQLMRLLTGIDQPTRGKVVYDFGQGRRINVSGLKFPIGFLPDHNLFVRGSVMENLSLFGSMSENDMMVLAMELGLHDQIMALPDGYDTILHQNSTYFSASEKRMLGWVQLFAQQAPLLVIDQPDLALDGAQRKIILQKLTSLADEGQAVLLASNNKAFTEIASHRYIISSKQIKPVQNDGPVRLHSPYAIAGEGS